MESEDYTFLWKWRKYLLLLATLVASVTYDAGLNPPGGVWPDDGDGHVTGDPVLPVTYGSRYLAFFYCNATAFVASLVVIMMLLDRRVSGNRVGVTVLRSAMALDLSALMGAYAAGVSRDVLAVAYVSALFGMVFAYVAAHVVVATRALPPVEWLRVSAKRLAGRLEELLRKGDDGEQLGAASRAEEDRQERRKFLLLLATFATPLTYAAGLEPPGGFWDKTEGGHTAGVPILRDGRPRRRYLAFFYCNATSFVASLAIVMLLMSRTLSDRVVRSYALQVCVLVELLGLMGAYAAGSCRRRETTVYVLSLAAAVLLYLALQVAVGMFAMGTIKKWLVGLCRILQCRGRRNLHQEHPRTDTAITQDDHLIREMKPCTAKPNAPCPDEGVAGGDEDEGDADDTVEESRSLLLLLATLAATVTYDAGLNPPGGFWPDGEHAGELILLERHRRRYKAFFHCNTAAFVASLVVIVIVQSKQLSSGAVVKRRALQAAMTLDLLGLMGAYAAGSGRDPATTIYVSALAVAVFIYSLGNVVAFTTMGQRRETRLMRWVDGMVQKVLEKLHLSDGQSGEEDDDLEKKRKFLLQLAILAATVTYKTGLTPPGGFWSEGDGAGDPVLLDHYRRRYMVFFYCNSTGFMASVAVILMLVNRRLYKQGIRCNALHACVVVGLLGLMLAYAAGSCRKLRTSVYVIALVAAVVGFLLLQILLFLLARHRTVRRHSAPLWAMQSAVVLDLLGLLGAYATGSCREWETSVYVVALVAAVVVYITLHVLLSFDAVAARAHRLKVWKYLGGGSSDQHGAGGNGAAV
uniref:PGG domain-containing protein n=1 Tax=Oryza brachyantha TaxID=4533 RepID=J3MDD8_ORYBR